MRDIARNLGVSAVTVSKALGNRSDVGPKTRQRILELARALDYQPNLAARAVSSGRSHIVGLIVPGLMDPFFAELAFHLGAAIRHRGYGLMISSSEDNPLSEGQEIERLMESGVSVLVIAPCQSAFSSLHKLETLRIPYVLVDRRPEGSNAHFIGVNDEQIGLIATQHLLDNGFRRIAHIGARDISTAAGRLHGYCRALKRAHLSVSGEYLVACQSVDDLGDENGYETMRKLLQLKVPPDAVFCVKDSVAAGAMKAILESGRQIPHDIGLVGCGNTLLAGHLRVPLSSVSQDVAGLGAATGKLALTLATSEELSSRKKRAMFLKPTLVVRESSVRTSAERAMQP